MVTRRPGRSCRSVLIALPKYGPASSPPAHARPAYPGRPGQRRGPPRRASPPAQPHQRPHQRRHLVVDRRAGQLVHRGAHVRAEAGPGHVRVVHVAGEHADRGRRRVRRPGADPVAARPPPARRAGRTARPARRTSGWNAAQCSRSTARRSFSANAAARGRGRVGQPLVPGLQVVDGRRQQPRQRRADHQVVVVAVGLVDEPAPLAAAAASPGAPASAPGCTGCPA